MYDDTTQPPYRYVAKAIPAFPPPPMPAVADWAPLTWATVGERVDQDGTSTRFVQFATTQSLPGGLAFLLGLLAGGLFVGYVLAR